MIVVIQCAASKCVDGGHCFTSDGRRVLFVAHPDMAPSESDVHYAHPDDVLENGATWRDWLVDYNISTQDNPLRLLPAIELYSHPTYELLSKKIGPGCLFVLSAGWGILPAPFLTPRYDITFNKQADRYKRRGSSKTYYDFMLAADDTEAPIVFFGGKDYAPLFAQLTSAHKGPRTVFFNSQLPPAAPGCYLERFVTTTRTNWHYECAGAWSKAL